MQSTASPRRAPVVPRVRPVTGGETLPIHDHLQRLLRQYQRGVVNLVGPAGSGKTVALEHVAHELSTDDRARLRLIDDAKTAAILAARQSLVLLASQVPLDAAEVVETFEIVPWTRDDWIEYLLATHPHRCASVMQRLQADADLSNYEGLPQLWQVVLEHLAADDSIPDVATALRLFLHAHMDDPERDTMARACIRSLKGSCAPWLEDSSRLPDLRILRLASLRPVRALLAAERIAEDLDLQLPVNYFEGEVSLFVLIQTARLVIGRPRALRQLQRLIADHHRAIHPACSTILLAADPAWRPADDRVPNLAEAHLPNAQWDGIKLWGAAIWRANLAGTRLAGAQLADTNFTETNLSRAILDHAWLDGAKLQRANLRGASLSSARAQGADFAAAKLGGARCTGADLKRSRFNGADLVAADFTKAAMRNTTFSGANLDQTCFTGANLRGADLGGCSLTTCTLKSAVFRDANLLNSNLAGVAASSVSFNGARLRGAEMTGSELPDARFRKADLRRAFLAEVQWERADLRKADLRGASFHLGSTRSGLVATPGHPNPPVSEGTRTGFYRDDSEEEQYLPPEQIRKANLCGADLRGARIDHVDFYLVDLRGARYSKAQRRHLLQCRAIL